MSTSLSAVGRGNFSVTLARRLLLVLCVLLGMGSFNAHAQGKPSGKPLPPSSARQSRLSAPSVHADATGPLRSEVGYTTNILPENDDSSSPSVPFGFGINFSGRDYSQLYVNNNGNVTFTAPLSTYTPFSLSTFNSPIIAPFLADVDTRGSTTVTYGNAVINVGGLNRPSFGVNWFNVGYYAEHTDKLNSFQLVLIDRSDTGVGNFDIEFNYDHLTWETGDASGGTGGFGGTSAVAGYANGANAASAVVQLNGSQVNGALLDSNAATGLSRTSNTGITGRYVFHIRGAGGANLSVLDKNPNPNLYLQPRQGALADGATELLVNFQSDLPGVVSLHEDGAVSGDLLTPVQNVSLQQVGSGYQISTTYRVPPGLIAPEVNHLVTFRADFTPTGGDSQPVEPANLNLTRPPVLLIHGLWADAAGTWNEMKGTRFKLLQAGYDVRLLDYKGTNADFFANNTPLIVNQIESELRPLRAAGIAATRLDVVGHSMGGILTRLAAQSSAGTSSFFGAQTFGKGYVRRLITLDTPHLGSGLANALFAAKNVPIAGRVVSGIFSAIDHPIGGAIEDLRVGSLALNNLRATPIRSFALIGDVGANQAAIDEVRHLYRALKFLGIHIDGLDTSSPESFSTSLFNGEANDGVVGGNSQRGGLPDLYVQRFSPIAHAPLPGITGANESNEMGDRVVSLLNGDETALAPGFPAVGNGALRGIAPRRSPVVGKRTSSAVTPTDTPFFSFVTPDDGAVVAPGTDVTLEVTPNAGSDLQAVLFTIGGQNVSNTVSDSALVEAAPFRTSFALPAEASGAYEISAFGRNAAGQVAQISRTIIVRPTATVSTLSVSPSPLFFSAANTTLQLSVSGDFSDGVSRDISTAATGTTFVSANPLVATVSADGLVTALTQGNTILTIRNGTVNTQVVVQIAFQAPQIFSVAPNIALPRTTTTVMVSGLNLGGVSSLDFGMGGALDPTVTATNLRPDPSGSFLLADVSVAANAPLGARTVVVTTSGGTSDPATSPFTTFSVGSPVAVADLSLSLTASPDAVAVGDTLTYSLRVGNAGPQAASGVRLSAALPAGVRFVSATSTQGTPAQNGGVVTCDIGAVPVGGSVVVSIAVQPTAPGSLTLSAALGSTSNDPNPANNSASDTRVAVTLTVRNVTPQIRVRAGGLRFLGLVRVGRNSYVRLRQTLVLQNIGTTPISGPLSLVLDGLGSDVTPSSLQGRTVLSLPARSPYLNVPLGAAGVLLPGRPVAITLDFIGPLRLNAYRYTPRFLSGAGQR